MVIGQVKIIGVGFGTQFKFEWKDSNEIFCCVRSRFVANFQQKKLFIILMKKKKQFRQKETSIFSPMQLAERLRAEF